ncbi:MAG: HlyD family efflux transporter periplasmic adaptor subunit [Pirellulales bacterium]|nr:HlyD family efflux transporter periplasmic adaptor subunit [Pirellulales bacterium]
MNKLDLVDQRPRPRFALVPLWVASILAVLGILALVFLKVNRVVQGRGVLVPPSNSVKVAVARPGTVAAILVKEGQRVAAGEVLARLDDREDKAAVEALSAQVAAAELEIVRRDELATHREGVNRLKREQLVSERAVEQAALPSLEADAARNGRDRERNARELAKKQSLAQRQVVTESELDKTTAEADRALAEQVQLDSQLAKARLTINQLRQKIDGVATEAAVETLQDELAELEARRNLATLHRQLAEAQLKLERATIKAPVAGTVHALAIRAAGEQVRDADVICRLVPPEIGMLAEIELPAADIAFVHNGQQARVKVDAFPFADYGAVLGSIEYVAPDADPQTAGDRKRRPVYIVRVRVDDAEFLARVAEKQPGREPRLRPGMTLTAELVNRRETLGALLFKPLRSASGEVGL